MNAPTARARAAIAVLTPLAIATGVSVATAADRSDSEPPSPRRHGVVDLPFAATGERWSEARRERLAERRKRREARRRAARPDYVHPVRGEADYGEAIAAYGVDRGGRTHAGQDVFAPAGTPLVAVADGRVVEAGSDGARGNHVAIYDRRKDRTYVYFHMIEPTHLSVGDTVEAGDRVGAVGCTGSCTGDHVHFEVRLGEGGQGETVDPRPLLERWKRLR